MRTALFDSRGAHVFMYPQHQFRYLPDREPRVFRQTLDTRHYCEMESVDSALRFLQKQFSGFENEAIQWNIEKRSLEDKVKELENEKVEQEDRFKDALLRIKMLEFALRQVSGYS